MLKIAQITDLHLLPPGECLMGLDVVARFERVMAHAAKFQPDVYFFTGDFCAAMPEEREIFWLGNRLFELEVPYFVVPGNHDDRTMLRNAFELPGDGDEPILQRVTIKDRTFLLLDTRYAKVGDAQINWLREQLKDLGSANIIMHHPPLKVGKPFMDDNYSLDEAQKVLQVLQEHDAPVVVYCGHYHSSRTIIDGNVTVHICPPTSFFIKPDAAVFEQDELPPAYQQIVYVGTGKRTVTPFYLSESPSVPPQ
ncbi:metallophosphoesterase [Lewinella sp. 4G2]|uniref:metallophosphoesterase n=1 Tax=Lewinella sp. 4G2 TaxID=1803372 RepID=UPI0007B483D9|nr:metallophosphoesterase [Lewinella sp. 4G2]OAV44138.1 hypothetical protein A3850_006335 [Lewinella sp. 4G2]